MAKQKVSERQKSFREWYERNREELSEKRRNAYRKDSQKREEARRRAKETRERRKAGMPVERVLYREYGGKNTPVYTTGYVASELGCSTTLILNWEKRGWIPEPVFDESHRLYLAHQVKLMHKLYKATQTGKAKAIASAVERVHDDW